MEPWELAMKLRKKFEGIEEVWESHDFLFLDEHGTPLLVTTYELKSGDNWVERLYIYENGEWMPKKDVSE